MQYLHLNISPLKGKKVFTAYSMLVSPQIFLFSMNSHNSGVGHSMLMLQIEKWRLSEIKQLSQGPGRRKRQS